MASEILIIDDEADIRELIAGILDDEGYETRLARDSDSALAAIEERRPSMIILDIWLQGSKLDGLDLLIVIKEHHPDLPVVIISGHGNIETAVAAIKRGAYEYIEKPFKVDRLILVVSRALEAAKLKRENEALREKSGTSTNLVGDSLVMKQLRQSLQKVAPTNSRIMVFGAMGTGKELVAQSLHALSHRAEGPFVVINAASLSPERMEEELFGVESAQGGVTSTGALEEAHLGTIFIDEVSDMPMETQAKILRVLVDQTFQRVGGNTRVKVDVRVVSSTSKDMDRAIAEGKFREDLFHRLNVVPVVVPPLSDRREDIPQLIEHFAHQFSRAAGQPQRALAEDALAVLQTQEWPGNVRQLKNNIERILILAGGEPNSEISSAMLPSEVSSSAPRIGSAGEGEHLMALPLREAREVFEREYLNAQVSRFGGNISKTASFVGMERSALHRKLKILGLHASTQNSDAAE